MAGTAADLYAPGMGAPFVAPDTYTPGSDPFLDSMYGVAPPPPVDSSLAGVQGANAGLMQQGGPQHATQGPILGPQLPSDASASTDQPVDVTPPPGAADRTGPPPLDLSAPAFPPPPAALPSMQPQAPAPPGVAQSPDITISMEGRPGAQPLGLPPGVAGPNLPQSELEYQQAVQQYQNPYDIPDPVQRQRALNALAQTDYGKFTELTMQRDRAEQADLLRKHEEAVNRDIEAQKQNQADFMAAQKDADAKMQTINAEAQHLAETKIGQLSIGQRIGGAIAAFIGGLYQGKTGSARNPGLDAFNDAVNRQIEGEKMDLANKKDLLGMRKSAIADQFARHGDMYRAQETVRMAAMQAADRQLAIEQQKYNINGRIGTDIAQARAGLAAQAQQSAVATHQKLLENSWKERTTAREEALARSTIASNTANTAKTYAEIAKMKGSDGQMLTPDQLAGLNRSAANPSPLVPPVPMTMKDYGEWLGTQSKGQEITNRSLATTNVIPGVTIKTKDGGEVPFVAVGRPEEVGALRDKKAASTSMVKLLDQALRLRTGYSNNNVADRQEWQQLQQIWGALKAKGKDSLGLGALSGDDYKLLEAYLGSADPTSVRDPTAGIKQARQTVMLDLNEVLHAKGLPDDQVFEIPDTSKPPPTRHTSDDQKQDAALGKARDVPTGAIQPGGDIVGPDNPDSFEAVRDRISRQETGRPYGEFAGRDAARQKARVEDLARQQYGQTYQRRQLDQLAQQAASPDPAVSKDAINRLAELAGTEEARGSLEPGARAYASQLLLNLAARQPLPEGAP